MILITERPKFRDQPLESRVDRLNIEALRHSRELTAEQTQQSIRCSKLAGVNSAHIGEVISNEICCRARAQRDNRVNLRVVVSIYAKDLRLASEPESVVAQDPVCVALEVECLCVTSLVQELHRTGDKGHRKDVVSDRRGTVERNLTSEETAAEVVDEVRREHAAETERELLVLGSLNDIRQNRKAGGVNVGPKIQLAIVIVNSAERIAVVEIYVDPCGVLIPGLV